MPTREGAGLPIGEVLKRARSRQELDIRAVEQQTKVRIKYLRALENEEWEVLPGHAYAKGFLRTYAHFLGLDGDALVDEYRRTVESSLGADVPFGFTEPVLERHLRPGEEPPRRRSAGTWAMVGLSAAVVVLVILALTGGADDGGRQRHPEGKQDRRHPGGGSDSTQGNSQPSQPVTLALVTRDDMLVCLVPGHGRPLIDSQTLVAGSQEGPFQPPADNYRLDLESGGAVALTLNGERQRVRSKGPASFAIDSNGVAPTSFKGPNCP